MIVAERKPFIKSLIKKAGKHLLNNIFLVCNTLV